MRRCERCGRIIYYDSCQYCGLTSGNGSGRKAPAPAGFAYFWIVIIILGVIAFVMDPKSVIPVAGIGFVIWAMSRLGRKNKKQ
ncbi:MAG TPA: hypothetical protein PK369_05990 [Thermoclostridium sp.]|nr:hypothetical protein [Clostridiaceae bacterium]HOQ76105.1 hypothetical protein [Thermoclostridium sp.]